MNGGQGGYGGGGFQPPSYGGQMGYGMGMPNYGGFQMGGGMQQPYQPQYQNYQQPPSFAQLFGGMGGFGGNYGFNPSGGNMWGPPQNNYGFNPSGGNMWPGPINKQPGSDPTGGQWQPPQQYYQNPNPYNGPTAMGGAGTNYMSQLLSQSTPQQQQQQQQRPNYGAMNNGMGALK